MEQRQTVPAKPHANCRFVSKINYDYFFLGSLSHHSRNTVTDDCWFLAFILGWMGVVYDAESTKKPRWGEKIMTLLFSL